MWRHFGKPEIVAVINNPILHASLQIRRLLTGRTTQGNQRTIALHHPPRARPIRRLQSSVTTCRPIINEQIGMNLHTADNNNSVIYLHVSIFARRPYWTVGSHAYESLKY